jgi:hypothetical protein
MTSIHYNLNDYNAILFGTYKKSNETQKKDTITADYKMDYTLPQNVLQIIQQLTRKFGGLNVSSVESVVKPRTEFTKDRKQHRFHSPKTMDDSWISARDFKPTTVIEKKEGTDKIMNDIRISLNKISNKNYDTNRDVIFEKINELIKYQSEKNSEEKSERDELDKIANNIFEIASTNKFFSEIYARLYNELTEKFPEVFSEILNTFIQGFTETMKTIRYVDQNVNYDDFCKYNKENDKRKATSVFITNLVKFNVLEKEILFCMIKEIQLILDGSRGEENRTNEVEEITENIFLLMTNHLDILRSMDMEILDKIRKIGGMKQKEAASISSRAIFKHMDILDKIK